MDRGTEGDLAEAQQAINWLAKLPAEEGSVIAEITLLQMRALQARARRDDGAYRGLAIRYHETARSLGFEGHIDRARAMIEDGK